MKKKYDIYTLAKLNSTFVANYPGDSEIMNQLYADIWNDEEKNYTEKQTFNDALETAYNSFVENPDENLSMYSYF